MDTISTEGNYHLVINKPEPEKKKYNQNLYNTTFKQKNAGKIKESINCPLCYGSYTYFNKSKHNKSYRHIKALNTKNNEPENLKNLI